MSSSSNIAVYKYRASQALLAGDYQEALRYAQAALLELASVPEEMEKGGDANAKVKWNPEHIHLFIKEVRKSRREASYENIGPMGMSVHPIRYESEVTRDG